MKIKFKHQKYQEEAVMSVVDCFKGQPFKDSFNYMVDPGNVDKELDIHEYTGFRNSNLEISEDEILRNIKVVQKRQNLPQSNGLVSNDVSKINLDIEMETGTGKTYCYIKSIFELNREYGWNKFVIVVPSIAIREGVYKSLEITADHFLEDYHKKAKFFIYNSSQLHELNSFATDSGINVMVINVQAFNAKGKDNRRIYQELDDFQSRRPIDVVRANRPIMIVDEPQKIGTGKSFESLKEFNPLMILRYSATHKVEHNKIHRLDALDAYNQKLVKKISVKGITVKSLTGTNSNLYLEGIDISKSAPTARIEMDIKQTTGPVRKVRRVKKGDNLFELSGGLDEYKDYVVSEIDAVSDKLSFTNGINIEAGELHGDDDDKVIRRIQIRETIKSHFEKESILFHKGIKTLSLFFIDQVSKYRQYDSKGEKLNGEYAQIFKEEYEIALKEDNLYSPEYRTYLLKHSVDSVHNGYFSIDKKTKRLVDPKMTKTEAKKGEANDVDAYDLILKDKERLLSFEEPIRFIFSHSALREGWDNPNVFTICTLKHSDNSVSRRQEVGRGLRICVNEYGERQDDPATVHQINVLTVVANESYQEFVSGLQTDISETLSSRPKKATIEYFKGQVFTTDSGELIISEDMAEDIFFYLKSNGYIESDKSISAKYFEEKDNLTLKELPETLKKHSPYVFKLIDSVYSDIKLNIFENGRGNQPNKLNSNFDKKEFKELWSRINRKAIYNVSFDSKQLIDKAVLTINTELKVSPLTYIINSGIQKNEMAHEELKEGGAFKQTSSSTFSHTQSVHSKVKYDLIGKISESVELTRKSVATILSNIMAEKFDLFKVNPEGFISEITRLIKEQKATMVIEHLTYDTVNQEHNVDIFTDGQASINLSKASEPLQKHIYDYVVTDSNIEKDFAKNLDISNEVVVYAKLPKGFYIPTPVGQYNPDWAISFKEGSVKHIYFVAETKGSLSSLELREVEKTKIRCAKKFFDKLNSNIDTNKVKYDVVNSYGALMDVVK